MKTLSSDHKILLTLLTLVIIRGVIYIAVVPPWLAPDEPAHFEAIRLLGQEYLLPTTDVYKITPMHPGMAASFEDFRIWQITRLAPPHPDKVGPENFVAEPFIDYYPPTSTGHVVTAEGYPLVYHRLLAPLSGLLAPLPVVQQLYVLRLTSLLFTLITVTAGWFFARTIFPGNPVYALGATSFLIFLPMHMHVNTSVNADVLATMLASLFLLMLVRIFRAGISTGKLLLAASLLLIGILTKPTTLFLIPTVVVAITVYLARRLHWSPKLMFLLLALFSLIFFVGGVLFFQGANGGRIASISSFSTDSISSLPDYFSREALAVYLYTIRWGFLSFWGQFGWANLPLPGTWLWLLWRICGVVAVGVAIFLLKHVFRPGDDNNQLHPAQKDMLLVLFFGLIFALIQLYIPIIATQSAGWGPPSRYLFPALLPLALYAFLGFQQLLPASIWQLALPLWGGSLILFDALALGAVLLPVIYG
jgi:hypothetical protein